MESKRYEEARIEVLHDIWEIAKKSPEHGNALMDLIGEDAYIQISKLRGEPSNG